MRTWLASLLVVLALAGAAGAQDYYDDAPDPDDYESALEPHGGWYDVPTYGRVWQPRVVGGWSPYTDGRWVWTAYGWTWVSIEPWAWTFHYGRWALAPSYGWVWVPGTVWGPAWVDWVYYDGYVGWAPLGPFGWRAGFDDYWFVRDGEFCNPRLRSAYVRHDRLPRNFRDDWTRHRVDRVDRNRIERVTRHPVQRYGDRPSETLAPWHRTRVERDRDGRGRQREWGAGDRRRTRPDDDGRDRRRYDFGDRDRDRDDDVSTTRRPIPSSRPDVRQPEPPLPPPVVRERRNDPGTVTRSAPSAPTQRPSSPPSGSGAWRSDVRPDVRSTAPRDGGGRTGGQPRGDGGGRGGGGVQRSERPAAGGGGGGNRGAASGRSGGGSGYGSTGYSMPGRP
jgi:hypothetical protein